MKTHQSKIEKLIAELCPNGVEFRELEEVCNVLKGKQLNKSELSELGDYPAYNGGVSYSGFTNKYNVEENTTIISQGGASAGFVQFITKKFWANAHCYYLKPNLEFINNKFLFYLVKNEQENFMTFQHGAGIPALKSDKIKTFQIPLPPLTIQTEIVRILDTFTELTAELTTELTARKKQYSYYRDQLLTFPEDANIEWKTLGAVTKKSYSGGTPTAGNQEYYDSGTIPWLRTKEVKFSDIEVTEVKITPAALKKSAAKWIPVNCVIIAISGATAGRSAINKIPLTTNQHCCCLEIDPDKALYRYVFYWVSFNYENLKGLGQGARSDLNSGIIKNFKVPIPHPDDPKKSLAEQARIVSILDKFDTLTNSISEGLPREMALRQKQYAYYRDLLLNFPQFPSSGGVVEA